MEERNKVLGESLSDLLSQGKMQAALALLEYARAHNRGRVVGHLCTTWVGAEQIAKELLGEAGGGNDRARQIVETLRACLARLAPPPAP